MKLHRSKNSLSELSLLSAGRVTTRAIRMVVFALGVLVFATANQAKFLSLDAHQLWIFQQIVRLMGLGLIAAATIGSFGANLASQSVQRFDKWILQDERRITLLLTILIFSYAICWSAVTFTRHFYFHSGMDLGNQDQVVWNSSQGRPFARSIEVTNDLADHIRPYLVLLSPIYMIVPSPYILLGFQASILALSAWPLYRLARRKFNSPGIALTVAFCALAYPPLGLLNRYDFHAEVIAVPLLIAAYERIDVKDFMYASLFLALALLGKENIGLSVAALGLVVALFHKHWRFGLAWASAGLAYSLIATFVVIPSFRGASPDTVARYQWLGDTPLEMLWTGILRPMFVLQHLMAAENLLSLLQLFAPFAFLPLLGGPLLLPAIPTLFYNFLSSHPHQTTIYYHYVTPVIPFIFIGGVTGLHKLTTSTRIQKVLGLMSPANHFSDQLVRSAASIMLLSVLASWLYENPVTSPMPHWNPRFLDPQRRQQSATLLSVIREGEPKPEVPVAGIALEADHKIKDKKIFGGLIRSNHDTVREALKHVPPNAHVRTTGNYLPHLSHRIHLQSISGERTSDLRAGVEAIFLNLRDMNSRRSCKEYLENLQMAVRLGFGVTFYHNGVLLVEKAKGDFRQLKEVLKNWPGCNR